MLRPSIQKAIERIFKAAKAASGGLLVGLGLLGGPEPVTLQAAEPSKPNIVIIMSDDVGIWNIGAYSRGMMAGKTPHLDKLAKEGMLFTDYYAEASCTAGRANFITGELPVRTGMTTVGQAGPNRHPAEACTIATALKPLGYATGHLARTTSAISMGSCRPSTASTSSSVISITSTRWRTPRTPRTRRSC